MPGSTGIVIGFQTILKLVLFEYVKIMAFKIMRRCVGGTFISQSVPMLEGCSEEGLLATGISGLRAVALLAATAFDLLKVSYRACLAKLYEARPRSL